MFCKNCGTLNDDEAKFCKNCGTILAYGQSGSDTMNYQYEQKSETPYTGEIKDGASEIIRKNMNSPAILIAAIANTVKAAGAVILILILIAAIVIPSFGSMIFLKSIPKYYNNYYDDDYDDIDDFYFNYNGEDIDFDGIFGKDGKLSEVGALFISITLPSIAMILCALTAGILNLVGLWKIYLSAKKDPIGTSGFTAIKVSAIIKIITVCLAAFVCVVSFIIIGNAGGFYVNDIAVDILWFTLAIFVVTIGVFSLIFDIKVIRDMNALKNTVLKKKKLKKPSIFVPIMLIASVLPYWATIVSLYITAIPFVAYNIALAVAIFKYRSDVKKYNSQIGFE